MRDVADEAGHDAGDDRDDHHFSLSHGSALRFWGPHSISELLHLSRVGSFLDAEDGSHEGSRERDRSKAEDQAAGQCSGGARSSIEPAPLGAAMLLLLPAAKIITRLVLASFR